jgi:hypothetical protein
MLNFASGISMNDMNKTEKITIKNPSRKLEETIRKIGVQKYLWLEKLCTDDTKPTQVITL